MQRPKNYNGSAVPNRAYGTQVTGSAVPNRAYGTQVTGSAVTNRAYDGRGQTRLETAPMECGLPADAGGNRAYGTQVTGRRGL